MKAKILYIILCALAFAGLAGVSSCEKMDDNGDLGGNWQLISWERLSDGSLVATNADSIFYTFQGKLMKTQRMSQPDFFLATFRTTTDSLVMLNIYASPYDSLVAPSALSAYGVSPSGRSISTIFRPRASCSQRKPPVSRSENTEHALCQSPKSGKFALRTRHIS